MRSGTLERKTSLRRGDSTLKRTELKRGGRLRARSAKRQKLYEEERIPLVKAFLAEHPFCQLRLPDLCWGRATTVHEVKTRGRGGSIVNRANCRAACIPCNDHVADPKYAAYVAERDLLRHSWEAEAV